MGVRDRKMRYDTTGNKLRFSLVIQNFEKAGDLYSTFLAKLPKLFSRKRDNGILYVKLRLYINQLFFMQRWLMIRSKFILNYWIWWSRSPNRYKYPHPGSRTTKVFHLNARNLDFMHADKSTESTTSKFLTSYTSKIINIRPTQRKL